MNALFWELPLVFVSGVLGSAHCIGMCGGISAIMNSGTTSVRSSLGRQMLWSTGRVFTYAFLGMLAGFAAAKLSRTGFVSSQTNLIAMQAGLAILAGVLLVVQGMSSAGWIGRRVQKTGPCLTATVFGKFLQCGSAAGVFIAGILTGFLPCGLVYSFLALSAASASVWKGPLIMTAFGMGTVPVMLLTGAGLSMASLDLRRRLMKVAAICVIATGLLTLGRGITFAASSETEAPTAACPLCTEAS